MDARQQLNDNFQIVRDTVLEFQSPTTGLFPLQGSSECEIADVRTTIYSSLSLWSLHLAFRRNLSDDGGRTHLLGQASVKAMRGILASWMYQIDQLKKFLQEPIPENALHVQFDLDTGRVLQGPTNQRFPHLQLDCVSLYLLSLVQMIASGLQAVYTPDEVDFVQNLVFYVERAYRIADFGQWGRGTKYNNGTPELNASSVGMAKAAMEAVNGFNLYGENGASWTVIYVDIDAHKRNRMVFESLIPRESSSKMADAALLPALTWPCFAIHHHNLKGDCIENIVSSLGGPYGLRRFDRDGFGTILEDDDRRFYESSQLKTFEGIECQWPYLHFFLVIDAFFSGDVAKATSLYEQIIPSLSFTADGLVVVPRYYYVPRRSLEAERAAPDSTQRTATSEGPNNYFLLGQAVYVVMKLLLDNLVTVNEIDPIKRYLSASDRPKFNLRYMSFRLFTTDQKIQVAVIAESTRLEQTLAVHGIMSQTPSQVEPLQIWSPNSLKAVLSHMGRSQRLGLAGRPERPVGLLGTSMFYRVCGQTVISYPLLFELNDFYISQDINSVIAQVQHDLEILANTWKLSGRPTYLIMVTEAMVLSPNAKDLIDLLASLKTGLTANNVKVKIDRLQSLATSGTKERLDFLSGHRGMKGDDSPEFSKVEDVIHGELSQLQLHLDTRRVNKVNTPLKDLGSYPDWKLHDLYKSTSDEYVCSQALKVLLERHGLQYEVAGVHIDTALQEIRKRATLGACQDWYVVRLCSAMGRNLVDSLAPSITTILVKGNLVTVGPFGHEERLIDKPFSPSQIGSMLYDVCYPVEPCEAVLQQEMILLIGNLHSTQPHLFNGILKIRIGWIIHAMQCVLESEMNSPSIYSLAPSEISDLLMQVLNNSSCEPRPRTRSIEWQRRLDGSLGRLPLSYYNNIWSILERTPAGIRVKNTTLPQQPTLSNLTLGEQKFKLLAEELLSSVEDPVQRQITVEILMVVATSLERNKELRFPFFVDVDKILEIVLSLFGATLKDQSTLTAEEIKCRFYLLDQHGPQGTLWYICKGMCQLMITDSMDMCAGLMDQCKVM